MLDCNDRGEYAVLQPAIPAQQPGNRVTYQFGRAKGAVTPAIVKGRPSPVDASGQGREGDEGRALVDRLVAGA